MEVELIFSSLSPTRVDAVDKEESSDSDEASEFGLKASSATSTGDEVSDKGGFSDCSAIIGRFNQDKPLGRLLGVRKNVVYYWKVMFLVCIRPV